jgi:hypothetical protein
VAGVRDVFAGVRAAADSGRKGTCGWLKTEDLFRYGQGAIRKNRCLGAGFLFSHTLVDILLAA